MITNHEKEKVWQAYRDRKPIRVPVTLGVNPRVIALDPQWNPQGITFKEYFNSAQAAADIQLRFMHYQAEYINQFCDNPLGLPKEFVFYVDTQNIYDSAYFGCPVEFRDGQVPDATPILAGGDKERIFRMDIDRPMENPFVQQCLRRYEDLKSVVAKLPDIGVKYSVRPPLMGFDGHLTIATCLRGTELFCDIIEDPPYVRRLMAFIQKAVEIRNRALNEHFGAKAFDGPSGWHADDSVQLISTHTYREMVLPFHKSWYANWSVKGPHSIHLCGDATRHYPILRDECNVFSFDTGFPVDHGALRRTMGPEVEIYGGPEVALLVGGTAQQVYERTRGILQSGIKAGGRFVLREGNNLPPRCPQANLAAFYKAALEFGKISGDPEGSL